MRRAVILFQRRYTSNNQIKQHTTTTVLEICFAPCGFFNSSPKLHVNRLSNSAHSGVHRARYGVYAKHTHAHTRHDVPTSYTFSRGIIICIRCCRVHGIRVRLRMIYTYSIILYESRARDTRRPLGVKCTCISSI